jgi:hypothetical protein
MPPKESSAIASLRWLPPATLEVTFKTGHIYAYSPVSRLEHARLMAAESRGEYFNKNIKGKVKALKIGKVKGPK